MNIHEYQAKELLAKFGVPVLSEAAAAATVAVGLALRRMGDR